MKLSVMFAFFPYQQVEHPDIRRWTVPTILKCKADPRIGEIHHIDCDDTPITMTRNLACKRAKEVGADLLCMIDNDMRPDLYLGTPGAKPFWDSTLDFMIKHHGPCCVAAPYCGPPPHENIYVFRLAKKQSDHPNQDFAIEQFSREDAAPRAGIEEVAALPTGLFLMDVRGLDAIDPPWFDYDYADPPFNTRKSTTEDVFFTRNLTLAGVPVYCNWDAWAGHHKRKCVGKPVLLCQDAIRKDLRDAIQRGYNCNERLIDIRSGGIEK